MAVTRSSPFLYRRCHYCGKRYNVSVQDKGPKKYECPACTGKIKAAHDGANIESGKKD